MAEADAEQRHLAHEVADRGHAVVEHLGIARAVREKHAVGPVSEDVCGSRLAGEHGHPAATAREMPGDVPLHAVVERHHMLRAGVRRDGGKLAAHEGLRERRAPGVERLRPGCFCFGHHLADKIAAHEGRGRPRHGYEFPGIEYLAREHARHGAADAQPADERPRIDAGDAHDTRPGQIVTERARGGEVARDPAGLADHEARHLEPAAFDVGRVHAVVADLRRGHRENLTAIGGVGEDLLIAGHRGVETDLARDGASRPEGVAEIDRAVFEGQCRACHRHFASSASPGAGAPSSPSLPAAHSRPRVTRSR